MAVYIDSANITARGDMWCHLVADTINELHAFAANLPSRTCSFHRASHHPHYDIRIGAKELVLKLGALEVSKKQIVLIARNLRAASSNPAKIKIEQRALF